MRWSSTSLRRLPSGIKSGPPGEVTLSRSRVDLRRIWMARPSREAEAATRPTARSSGHRHSRHPGGPPEPKAGMQIGPFTSAAAIPVTATASRSQSKRRNDIDPNPTALEIRATT